jgi:hypothetical protein
MRISFEVSPPTSGDDGVEIEVYLDRAGRDRLVRELIGLSDTNDHFHMFSLAWGSDELTEERRTAGTLIGRHVKIYLRPEGELLWSVPTQAPQNSN